MGEFELERDQAKARDREISTDRSETYLAVKCETDCGDQRRRRRAHRCKPWIEPLKGTRNTHSVSSLLIQVRQPPEDIARHPFPTPSFLFLFLPCCNPQRTSLVHDPPPKPATVEPSTKSLGESVDKRAIDEVSSLKSLGERCRGLDLEDAAVAEAVDSIFRGEIEP